MIDVAHEEAAEISEHLYSLPLDMYSGVMFVPFMKIDETYEQTLQRIIQSNHEFNTSVEELNIPMLRFFNYGLNFTSDCTSLRDIIFKYNTPERNFIHDVDVDRNGAMSIIYNLEHSDKNVTSWKTCILSFVNIYR